MLKETISGYDYITTFVCKSSTYKRRFCFRLSFSQCERTLLEVHNYVETSLDGRVHEMKTCCFNEHGSRE